MLIVDTIETYLDSHVDLLQRRIQKHSDRIKRQAESQMRDIQETFKKSDFKLNEFKLNEFKLRDLSGPDLLDKEYKRFQDKVSVRMARLTDSWQSAKVVRTRDKLSFFYGVNTLLLSALAFGLAPQYVAVVGNDVC